MKIMAIDPGMMTGIVCAELDAAEQRAGWAGVVAARRDGRITITEIGRMNLRGNQRWVKVQLRGHGADQKKLTEILHDIDHEYVDQSVKAARLLLTEVEIFNPHVIVVEDFVLYPGRQHSSNKDGISPATVWNAVEMKLMLDEDFPAAGIAPIVVRQMASEAKGIIIDRRLRDWGLWLPGMKHSRDAMRHLLVYLRKQRGGVSGG